MKIVTESFTPGPYDLKWCRRTEYACLIEASHEDDVTHVAELLDGEQIVAIRQEGKLVFFRENGNQLNANGPSAWERMFNEIIQDYYENLLGSLMEEEGWVFRWMAFQRKKIYELPCAPIILTDAIDKYQCLYPMIAFLIRAEVTGLPTLKPFHSGRPINIQEACKRLGNGAYGAQGGAYGALWRVERPRRDFIMPPVQIARAEAVFKYSEFQSQ